jgi:hypothetical protein
MTDTNTTSRKASNQLDGALAGWETKGGAPQAAWRADDAAQVSLSLAEERILQCLGAAVIAQWNDLPTRVQRRVFDHAVSLGDPRHTRQVKEQIARFLHDHKDDTRYSA